MKTTDQEVLGRVNVASPCSESWESMPGSTTVRSCERCRHKVYNLSEMTARDAAALIENAEGRLCVRFYRRADGTMLTSDCPVGVGTRRRNAARRATALTVAAASAACATVAGVRDRASRTIELPMVTIERPEPMMGAIAAPAPVMGEMPAPTEPEVIETMGKIAVPGPPRPTMGMVAPSPAIQGRVARPEISR